jgi:hypothetical protein
MKTETVTLKCPHCKEVARLSFGLLTIYHLPNCKGMVWDVESRSYPICKQMPEVVHGSFAPF